MQDKENSSYDAYEFVDVSKSTMSSYIIHNLKGATRHQSKIINCGVFTERLESMVAI